MKKQNFNEWCNDLSHRVNKIMKDQASLGFYPPIDDFLEIRTESDGKVYLDFKFLNCNKTKN